MAGVQPQADPPGVEKPALPWKIKVEPTLRRLFGLRAYTALEEKKKGIVNEYYANSIPPQNAARSIKGFWPLALFRVGALDLFPGRIGWRCSGSSVAGLL
jgi:hypothetical protein